MAEHPPFCDQCGRSLRPLAIPHVSRPCDTCGKTIYLDNQTPDGKGIQVEKGDTFTIPAGWLTISLDPAKSRGNLTKHGVNWFVTKLIFDLMPTEPGKVADFLRNLDKQADQVLMASSRMPGLDVNSPEDMGRAFEKFKDETDTSEWYALILSALAQQSLNLLREETPKEELAVSIARTVATYMMLIYKTQLESHVWAGYEQTRLVYNVATAAASTPTEALAIEALRPAFENLSEEVLSAWVGAGVSIGERLGISDIDDSIVNALAEYHLAQFERRRQEQISTGEVKSRKWANRIAAASVGAVLAGVLVTLLIQYGIVPSPKPAPSNAPTPSVSISSTPHSPSVTPSPK